jgi:predicted  nucleic acid-binding Zn-ribbon protein
LLAQTRQADRDKAHADADAQHREALAAAAEQRQMLAAEQGTQMMELLQQNTQLTELVKNLSQRIETLTIEMHGKVIQGITTS